VHAALSAARQTGWDGLLAEQRAFLDTFWDRADVEVDGDSEVQQAVRFALFHVLQAGARAENRAIPAKGLTGPGYGGHTFWDTETFVLPMLPSRPDTRCVGGALLAIPIPTAGSTSTESQARTSTALWPTTTSIRT
jgi:alpha,alpha-trehalose phosphorylase